MLFAAVIASHQAHRQHHAHQTAHTHSEAHRLTTADQSEHTKGIQEEIGEASPSFAALGIVRPEGEAADQERLSSDVVCCELREGHWKYGGAQLWRLGQWRGGGDSCRCGEVRDMRLADCEL